MNRYNLLRERARVITQLEQNRKQAEQIQDANTILLLKLSNINSELFKNYSEMQRRSRR